MEVTSEAAVGELVIQLPRASRVFSILEIDFCCNGDRPLGTACAAAGYDCAEVVALINGSETVAVAPPRPTWNEVPLAEITSHIVQFHHRGSRRLLVDVLERIDRIGSAHAAAHPELWHLKRVVEKLAHKLVPHMLKEERYLFRYIDTMEGPVGADDSMLVPLFGTLRYPLQSIHHDHTEDLSLIAMIRRASGEFTAPKDACADFRILYTMLAELAKDLEEHIYLENDVLFPRAIEAERKAQRQA